MGGMYVLFRINFINIQDKQPWTRLTRSYVFFTSTQPGCCVEAKGPSGPHKPALHPPPDSPDLIWHPMLVRACVSVWSRLDDGSDDTVISVGGLFPCAPPRLQPSRLGRAGEKNFQRKGWANPLKLNFRDRLHVCIFFL